MCEGALTFIFGHNKEGLEMDTRIIPNFLQHMSHAVSVKQFRHFIQLMSSGRFRQYDYQEKNRKAYNSTTPPDYNLKNVIAKIYIYSGGCDAIISERDVEHLKEVLSNVRKFRSIRNYNHGDFVYAKNARSTLYNGMVSAMNSEKNWFQVLCINFLKASFFQFFIRLIKSRLWIAFLQVLVLCRWVLWNNCRSEWTSP